MSDLDNVERRLRAQLAELCREYRVRAKPIVDQLVRIEAMKTPSLVMPLNALGGDIGHNAASSIDLKDGSQIDLRKPWKLPA